MLPLTQPFCYAVVHNGTARGVELKLERREERERNEHDEGAERTGEETVAVDLEREHDGAEDDEIGEHDRRCHGDDEGDCINGMENNIRIEVKVTVESEQSKLTLGGCLFWDVDTRDVSGRSKEEEKRATGCLLFVFLCVFFPLWY